MTISSMYDVPTTRTVVKVWEQSTPVLSDDLSSYPDLCISSEEHPRASYTEAYGLAKLIELPSFNDLSAKFTGGPVQSSVALARMSSTVQSHFNALPQEMIAQIFLEVVYCTKPTDKPNPSMLCTLEAIFLRIKTLLSVCSFWKSIGLSLAALWYFVPIADGDFPPPVRCTVSLSLQRAWAARNKSRLYLAAILPPRYSPSILPTPDGRAPQFNAINIEAPSISAIVDFLSALVESQVPGTLSELSILRYYIETEQLANRPGSCLIDSFPDAQKELIIDLIGSLSILRVRSVDIRRWDEVTFSNRLTKLHLEAVTIGNYSKLIQLLQALQLAPELHTLKLSTIFASPEPIAPAQITLKKLHSLYLENLDFGVLRLLVNSIAPGSHHLTLYLTPQVSYIRSLQAEAEFVNFLGLTALLQRSRVSTLLLNGFYRELWMCGPHLSNVLESLPTLSAVQFVNCGLTKVHLLALERTARVPGRSEIPRRPFPNLSRLSLINTVIGDVDTLKHVVGSHRLELVELSSNVTAVDSDNEDDPDPSLCCTYTDQDDIVQWLRNAVPQFNLVDEAWGAQNDFRQGVWPLW
ncbi:unnamed protein product [Rhizoctonia solani]|uniref:F-box domain-containing protein n=1 Tax=Rhizoctonia solani TaxID=456999 RepID=A0A8H3DRR8_9AGAM|nr:unnamed protein product [Rhizoctonia solani]